MWFTGDRISQKCESFHGRNGVNALKFYLNHSITTLWHDGALLMTTNIFIFEMMWFFQNVWSNRNSLQLGYRKQPQEPWPQRKVCWCIFLLHNDGCQREIQTVFFYRLHLIFFHGADFWLHNVCCDLPEVAGPHRNIDTLGWNGTISASVTPGVGLNWQNISLVTPGELQYPNRTPQPNISKQNTWIRIDRQ